MRAAFGKTALVIATTLVLTACGEPQLMGLSTSDGPDEFLIVPGKPLEKPKNYAELPAPTPGSSNLTDATPFDDAAIALGGRAIASAQGGVPSSDGALVNHARRFGSQENVREVLAAEDLEFRKRNRGRLLIRLTGQDRYYDAYDELWLDRYTELERLRAAGVKTPSPPPNTK